MLTRPVRRPGSRPSRQRRRPSTTNSVASKEQNKWDSLYGKQWEGMNETADDAMIADLVNTARNKELTNINNMVGRGQISRSGADSLLGELEKSLLGYQAGLNTAGRTSIGNFNDDQRSYLGTTFNTGASPNFAGALGYLGGDSFMNQKNDYLNSTLSKTLGANQFDFSPNINNALISGASSANTDPMFSAMAANKNKKLNQSFSF